VPTAMQQRVAPYHKMNKVIEGILSDVVFDHRLRKTYHIHPMRLVIKMSKTGLELSF